MGHDQKKKYDRGKPRWDLLPWDAVEEVVKVMTWAIEREDPPPYAEGSWMEVTPFYKRYISALFRHFKAWICGETHDSESGLRHTAHMATNAIFILWKDKGERKYGRTEKS